MRMRKRKRKNEMRFKTSKYMLLLLVNTLVLVGQDTLINEYSLPTIKLFILRYEMSNEVENDAMQYNTFHDKVNYILNLSHDDISEEGLYQGDIYSLFAVTYNDFSSVPVTIFIARDNYGGYGSYSYLSVDYDNLPSLLGKMLRQEKPETAFNYAIHIVRKMYLDWGRVALDSIAQSEFEYLFNKYEGSELMRVLNKTEILYGTYSYDFVYGDRLDKNDSEFYMIQIKYDGCYHIEELLLAKL
jgi:hypothetical protein